MLKFLIILFLICYIAIRMGGFIFRLLFSGPGGSRQGNFNSQSNYDPGKRKPRDSNLNIDHIPDHKKKGKHRDKGEYVDYEEVK